MDNLFGVGFAYILVVVVIPFCIFVAVSRWVFRVNDTIKRLDAILAAIKGKGSV